MIITKTSKEITEPYRIGYLRSLPQFQDIFLEFIVNESNYYLLQNKNEILGYVIVSPQQVLAELHILEKYATGKWNPLPAIVKELGVKSIYCKSFDHPLLNYCAGIGLPEKVTGFLYRDYNLKVNICPTLPHRYAETNDIPFLRQQEDEVFEPKHLIEKHIENKSIIIFEEFQEIIGCGFLTRIHPLFDYYDLGVWIHPEHRQKGYATRIISHLLEVCSDKNQKPVCGCDAQNIASQNLLDKVGFISNYKLLEFESETA